MNLIEPIRRLSPPLQPLPTGLPPRLRTLAGIRAVLFDVYGTLMISASGDVGPATAADSERAFRDALRESGIGTLPETGESNGAELLRREIVRFQERIREGGADFPEVDILQVWDRVLGSADLAGGPLHADEQALRRLALGYECRVNPVWPMPGCEEILAWLRERGLPMGIVSNAQFYTPLLFEALLGQPPGELGFQDSLCIWSYRELRGKPSRRLFDKVLSSLWDEYAILPGQTLYIGNDMLKDIWAASRTGCRTVLFAGDRRSLRLREQDARCRGLTPDAVIDDLRQLREILD